MRENQYVEDCARLAEILEKYTGVPRKQTTAFLMENGAGRLLPYANKLCGTKKQREKLSALFEFKNLYDTLKGGDDLLAYTMRGTDDAKRYFIPLFADASDKERVIVAYLNASNKVIKTQTTSVGTIGAAAIHIREIVKEALFINASAIMMAHNHPSGDTTPSETDKRETVKISQALEAVEIGFLDHIIVAGERAVSLRDMGLLVSRAVGPALSVREAAPRAPDSEKPGSMRERMEAATNEAARRNTIRQREREERAMGERNGR